MPCPPNELRHVPLFSLLDDDEIAVLSGQVELRTFAARQRIYKLGDIDGRAFILLTGEVVVSTVDEDGQEVVVQQPVHGEFFGFASMLEATAHVTTAVATEESTCLEIDRHDITVLLTSKPMAGLDMMSVLARQWHQSQDLIRVRATRSPIVSFSSMTMLGLRVADRVASFGGSWTFIIAFGVVLSVYTAINVALRGKAWDPYPFILLNLFLSMLAAIQAPVIMMSQNRQDKKDRVRSELDFDVNVRAESEIQALSRRMKELHDKLDDVDEHLRTGRE
jgi:CRP/FNR family cyclic AMP-dependent transcriptional regulator